MRAAHRARRLLAALDRGDPLGAGFDPSRPAAILAEGFLPYLDESVVARLFDLSRLIGSSGSGTNSETDK